MHDDFHYELTKTGGSFVSSHKAWQLQVMSQDSDLPPSLLEDIYGVQVELHWGLKRKRPKASSLWIFSQRSEPPDRHHVDHNASQIKNQCLPHFATLWRTLSHFVTLYHTLSHFVTLCRTLSHFVTLCHTVTMVRATILIMLIKMLLRLENQSLSFALVATTIQLGTRTNKVKAENAEYDHNRHLSFLKILHLVNSFCTTSGCDGFDKYQVWMWSG